MNWSIKALGGNVDNAQIIIIVIIIIVQFPFSFTFTWNTFKLNRKWQATRNNTIEKYSICDLRIENSQQHLIMWLFHCLCEANVKPHSIIIYLGQPACVLLLSIAMFCSFFHFKYFIVGFFLHISFSLVRFIIIGSLHCSIWLHTMWRFFFITRTHKHSSVRHYYYSLQR